VSLIINYSCSSHSSIIGYNTEFVGDETYLKLVYGKICRLRIVVLIKRTTCYGDIVHVERKDVQGASGWFDGQVGKIVGLMLSLSTSSY
jgi:hypothetical protein